MTWIERLLNKLFINLIEGRVIKKEVLGQENKSNSITQKLNATVTKKFNGIAFQQRKTNLSKLRIEKSCSMPFVLNVFIHYNQYYCNLNKTPIYFAVPFLLY